MTGISHKQAIKWVDRRLDGLLDERQRLSLEEHLRSCDSCRAYAAEMDLLPAHIQEEFHLLWDRNSGPSQEVFESVTAKARKIPMTNRFSAGLKLLTGTAILFLWVLALNAIMPLIRHTAISETTETPASISLKIDPRSCRSSSDLNSTLRPPNELYGYELIQGISFVDGDFSYEFWLYCDPTLEPDDKENLNIVAGLGVFSSWRYNGPEVDGENQYYFEFEPNVPLGRTAWNGPLYQASAGAKLGIDLPKTTVQEHVQQSTPIQFHVIVDSPLGHDGATLSFNLEPTDNGLKVANLQANRLADSYAGLIAFTAGSENGDLDIYSMHPDGSERTNLTHNPAQERKPFWSPDGTQIAFESDRTGSTQIYLMDADGSNITQLTEGDTEHQFQTSNSWSPDGSKLLFTESHLGDEKWLLYAIDVNGQNKAQLVQNPNQYSAATWSPDGKHIAFVRAEPQGNRNRAHIYVVDPHGNNLTDLTKLLPLDEDLVSWNLHWAADGGSIFFVASRYAWENNNARYAVYEASLDGGPLTETFVTSDRIQDWWDGTALIQGTGMPTALTWFRSDLTTSVLKPFQNCQATDSFGSMHGRSPNGYLLFGAQCGNGDLWLYWANPDGTETKQLLSFPLAAGGGSLVDITWSPDGAFVAFSLAGPDKTEMYVLNVNEALADATIQPEKYILGGPGIIPYAVSWQP